MWKGCGECARGLRKMPLQHAPRLRLLARTEARTRWQVRAPLPKKAKDE